MADSNGNGDFSDLFTRSLGTGEDESREATEFSKTPVMKALAESLELAGRRGRTMVRVVQDLERRRKAVAKNMEDIQKSRRKTNLPTITGSGEVAPSKDGLAAADVVQELKEVGFPGLFDNQDPFERNKDRIRNARDFDGGHDIIGQTKDQIQTFQDLQRQDQEGAEVTNLPVNPGVVPSDGPPASVVPIFKPGGMQATAVFARHALGLPDVTIEEGHTVIGPRSHAFEVLDQFGFKFTKGRGKSFHLTYLNKETGERQDRFTLSSHKVGFVESGIDPQDATGTIFQVDNFRSFRFGGMPPRFYNVQDGIDFMIAAAFGTEGPEGGTIFDEPSIRLQLESRSYNVTDALQQVFDTGLEFIQEERSEDLDDSIIFAPMGISGSHDSVYNGIVGRIDYIPVSEGAGVARAAHPVRVSTANEEPAFVRDLTSALELIKQRRDKGLKVTPNEIFRHYRNMAAPPEIQAALRELLDFQIQVPGPVLEYFETGEPGGFIDDDLQELRQSFRININQGKKELTDFDPLNPNSMKAAKRHLKLFIQKPLEIKEGRFKNPSDELKKVIKMFNNMDRLEQERVKEDLKSGKQFEPFNTRSKVVDVLKRFFPGGNFTFVGQGDE
jgi:hypothetical protein